MSESSQRPPAHQAVLGLLTAYWQSQLMYVVARLGVADALARGPRTPASIARSVGADPVYLRRVMRALAALGVFAETRGGKFRLTPLGQTLRSDHPESLRDFALMIVDDYNWNSWGALLRGVMEGETPFEQVYRMPVFAYLNLHPEKQEVFAASMASISSGENAAIAAAYPFGDFRQVVDVGGAHGHLLAAILRRHRRLQGVLYDQPDVVGGASTAGYISAAGVRQRVQTIGGDFFVSVPEGADLYMMKYIIHDWEDQKCLRILRNCRNAMTKQGRVLVVEHVIPPGNDFDWGKLLDINMLVGPGGQERTREEFSALFKRAGLRLTRVLPTESPLSILEARKL